MVKKLVVALIIVAMLVCGTGVVAKEDSSGSGSDSGGSSGSSSGSSGLETPHATDTPGPDRSGSSDSSGLETPHATDTPGPDRSGSSDSSGLETPHATDTPGSDRSGTSDSSGPSSSDRSSGSGTDNSTSGNSSSGDAAEIEIEHGISTITAHEIEHRSNLSLSSPGNSDPGRQSRDSAEIATTSLTALTSVQGATSSQLAEHAKTIEDSLSSLSAARTAIKTRNGIVIFFFGGDKAAANDIETHVNEDLAALNAMDKIVSDPTTSPALKSFTRQREATIRAELERLKSIAAAEKQKKGLFG